jgi:hypothetical protein
MPLVEISEARLRRVADALSAEVGKLGAGTVERAAAERALWNETAMLAAFIDAHTQTPIKSNIPQ